MLTNEYTYHDSNNHDIYFTVEGEQEIIDDEDLIKKIVADSYIHLKKTTNKKQQPGGIHLTILSSEDNIRYSMTGKIYTVARNKLNRNKIQSVIDNQQVTSTKPSMRVGSPVDTDSILRKYATPTAEKQSLLGKIQTVTSHFFTRILSGFSRINQTKLLRAKQDDMELLSDLCGSTNITKPSMQKSLKYMSRLLARDQKENPEVKQRVARASYYADRIQEINELSRPEKAVKKLSKDLQQEVANLPAGQKRLIPVGYTGKEGKVEMLLEVERQNNNTFTVTLIGSSREMRCFFDRAQRGFVHSQSDRRVITQVDSSDLLAVLPTLVELQTLPLCRNSDDSARWQGIFLHALIFPNSTVSAVDATTQVKQESSPGHMSELLSYIGHEKPSVQETDRFEIAARLHLFLDIVGRSQKNLADKEYWTLVRTTTYQLASSIHEHREVLSDPELASIYRELQSLMDRLDANPPHVPDINAGAVFPKLGIVQSSPNSLSGSLQPIMRRAPVSPTIDPPLAGLDTNAPLTSIKNWGERCRKLTDAAGLQEQAAAEAKIMTRLFPALTDPFWASLSEQEAEDVLSAMNHMAKAIAHDAANRPPTLHDIAMLTGLCLFASELAMRQKLPRCAPPQVEALEEKKKLMRSRLPQEDKDWLMSITLTIAQSPAKKGKKPSKSLLNISQLLAETSDRIKTPAYAETISQEISSRYLTEFCCLGCIRDNCPNYARQPHALQRFLPVYLAHNFIDDYCKKLIPEDKLHRDEAVDLLYTQQTNRNAQEVYNDHEGCDGFRTAWAFSEQDHLIQGMNTLSLYLDRPHFFKQADLRWHFEGKVLARNLLPTLMTPQYRPYLSSTLKKLNKEAALASAAGNVEVAAYLMHVESKIAKAIHASALAQQDKQQLLSLITYDIDEHLPKIAQELLSKTGKQAVEQQRLIFPLLLDRYYQKLCENPADPCFSDPAHQELILALIGKVNLKGGELSHKLDGFAVEHSKAVFFWIQPRLKAHMIADKGALANKVLTHLNPSLANQQLEWNASPFPILVANKPDGGRYFFNLLTGQINTETEQISPIPAQLRNSTQLMRHFGDTLSEPWAIFGTKDPHTTVYTHSAYPDYRIVVRELAEGGLATSVEWKMDGHWMTYRRFAEQDALLEGKSHGPLSDLPPAFAMAIGDRDCWVSENGKKIYVFTPGESAPYALLTQVKPNIQEMYGFQLTFFDNRHRLLSVSDTQLERFSTIEDCGFIQVKGKYKFRSKQCTQVNYPRYEIAGTGLPLGYHLEGGKATSTIFDGYRLAEPGVRPGLAKPSANVQPLPAIFEGYHLLEKDGDQKVLIPLRQYEAEVSVHDEQLLSVKPVERSSYAKTTVFEYAVDPETNRLKAKSAAAYSYLAYICAIHNDHSSAAYYLQKAHTGVGYDEDFASTLSFMSDWADNSPNGIALKLQFELLQEKALNEQRVKAIKKGKTHKLEQINQQRNSCIAKVAELYKQYRSGTDHNPFLNLSVTSENNAKSLIREIIATQGDDRVEYGDVMTRAEEMPLQSLPDAKNQADFHQDKDGELVEVHRGALLLWIYKGTAKGDAGMTADNPIWMLQNFRKLYNQILTLDVDSVEFKALEHRLRIESIFSEKKVTPLQKEAAVLAQNYLLKLAAAKKAHPGLMPALEEGLPTLKGPFFLSSRLKLVKGLEAPAPRDRQNAASRIAGHSSIAALSNILRILDDVEIKQPVQVMEHRDEVQRETYRERYNNLVQDVPENQSEIEALERDIFAREAPEHKLISTEVDHATEVLGSDLVGRCKTYFNESLAAAPDIPETLFDELSQSENGAVRRMAEMHRLDMRAYLNERTVANLTKDNAVSLRTDLTTEVRGLENREKEHKAKLLSAVAPEQTASTAYSQLVGEKSELTIDTLIGLWRQNKLEKLVDIGAPPMTPEQLQQLDQDIKEYLLVVTQRGALNRAYSAVEAFINSDNDPQLAQEAYELVCTKRCYSLDANISPDYKDLLLMEYGPPPIILREMQTKIVREMGVDPNAVRQAGMGEGKSKVAAPLLAKRKADGTNLVLLMLPDELYVTNCRDLDNTNRQLFGQEMYRFEFKRETDRNVSSLEVIYKRMLETIQNEGFMMTTKSSVLSLRNAYVELISLIADEKTDPAQRAEYILQLKAMSKIMTLFNERTDVLCDEVDACLDVRKEVNFALGDPDSIDPIKINVGAEVMRIINTDFELEPLRTLLLQNSQGALSPDQRKAYLRLIAEKYHDNHPELHQVTKDAFTQYIMNEAEDNQCESWVNSLEKPDNDLFKQITAFKGFINIGFQTTMSRVGNMHYGRDLESGFETIPYKASNTPSIGSKFDEEIEQLAFTFQEYYQNGVTYDQVAALVASLQRQASLELRQMQEANPDSFPMLLNTSAARKFREFVEQIDPDQVLGQITLATMSDPEAIHAIVNAVNQSPEARISMCQHNVAPRLAQYEKQIDSLSMDLVELFRGFGGYTGTPWNLHTYHDKINAHRTLGVDGRTWALLLGRDVPIKTIPFDPEDPVKSLLDGAEVAGNCQAVIDTGAYLRGIDNSTFTDAVLEKQNAAVKAVIYFDKSGVIVKKKSLDGKAVPLEGSAPADLMANFTLYDQAHTVGADIRQGKKAVAMVTIGETTFVRDLFQAVWRLRQLHQDQKIVFVVSDQIKEQILNGQNRDLTVKDILTFCLVNEALRESEDNFRAEKQRIGGATRRTWLSNTAPAIARSLNDEQIHHLAIAADQAKLFTKTKDPEASYKQYGKQKTQEKPKAILARLRTAEAEKSGTMAAAMQFAAPSLSKPFEDLKASIKLRPNPEANLFPNLVDSDSNPGSEVQSEAKAQSEQKSVVENQTEQQTVTEVAVELLIPQASAGLLAHGDVHPLKLKEIELLLESGASNGLRPLAGNVPYFDKEIYCSQVFERRLSPDPQQPSPPQSIFYSNRKLAKNVLIAKQDNKWMMVIPTTHETFGACQAFVDKQQDNAVQITVSPGQPQIMFKAGEDRTGEIPFTDQADKDKFYRLYIQAKLFNGETSFVTQEERDALISWLEALGPIEMRTFKSYFEQNILAARPKRFVNDYPKSQLYKIFIELGM